MIPTKNEVNNVLHLMNLDRPDIKALLPGATISCNITTHRQAADLIQRMAVELGIFERPISAWRCTFEPPQVGDVVNYMKPIYRRKYWLFGPYKIIRHEPAKAVVKSVGTFGEK